MSAAINPDWLDDAIAAAERDPRRAQKERAADELATGRHPLDDVADDAATGARRAVTVEAIRVERCEGTVWRYLINHGHTAHTFTQACEVLERFGVRIVSARGVLVEAQREGAVTV